MTTHEAPTKEGSRGVHELGLANQLGGKHKSSWAVGLGLYRLRRILQGGGGIGGAAKGAVLPPLPYSLPPLPISG